MLNFGTNSGGVLASSAKTGIDSKHKIYFQNKGLIGVNLSGTVDGRHPANHLECINLVNNGINYQPQLVKAGFQPSTIVVS